MNTANKTPSSNTMFRIGRALLGALFLVSGIGKIFGFAGVAGWMASAGLPFASLLLGLTIAIEVIGGLLLIIGWHSRWAALALAAFLVPRSEEHTSELQSQSNLVCRLLLEKK